MLLWKCVYFSLQAWYGVKYHSNLENSGGNIVIIITELTYGQIHVH